MKQIISKFKKKKIRTSLFINPVVSDVKISKLLDVDCIEIHTGNLSNLVKSNKNYSREFKRIKRCAVEAKNLGLEVHAGHGLDYRSTKILTKIKNIEEFNIGHYLIGESIFHGLDRIIRNFRKIINY